ncbi:phosphatase PAP2 family protein [Clostridium nigeriense]|uniref:phosphatase PAP2 family protein n=1 Tax=Clostridium nigeriense TaxID=1805470 RepID=UPI003D34CD5D
MSKRIKCIIVALTISITSQSVTTISAVTNDNESVEPQKATYGYFVDEYKKNTYPNCNTPETNPTLVLLSGFLKLWEPGDSWDNGAKLNEDILDANIQKSIDITSYLTEEQKIKTYLFDRRHQSYSSIEGLGEYASVFKEKTNAETSISDEIPEDATELKYNDKGNSNGNWADEDSELGSIVSLVNALRGSYSTSNPSKNYFAYMRPFRWSDEVTVLDTLIPVLKPVEEAQSDGGFPSGHTNAAYLASFALAYAVPEKYKDLLINASDIGNSRILAGMHSPLDVIGGRVLGTALAAAILNDTDNIELKEKAYFEGRELTSEYFTEEPLEEKIENYKMNKDIYLERLTYGFEKVGTSGNKMVVPKGAEVLLETRFPYLDELQRRYVLKTTGIDSGYPVLDDTEGWGRLNLYEASNGYGSFETDVTVNMDVSLGGFNSEDMWLNDIDGDGQLTKQGTGSLILAGDNTYNGGTILEDGSLIAYSSTAFGNGKVKNNGGTLSEKVEDDVIINDDFIQDSDGTLDLNLESNSDCLVIKGKASLNGNLKVNIEDGYEVNDKIKIIEYTELEDNSQFDNVEFLGLFNDYNPKIVYEEDGVYLVNTNVVEDNEELNANIEELKALIKKVELLDEDNYTSESYKALEATKNDAKLILSMDNINNEEVLEAITNLNNALNNLVGRSESPVVPDTDSNSNSDNNLNVNKPSELPETGGTNTVISLLLGSLTTIGGALLYKKKK